MYAMKSQIQVTTIKHPVTGTDCKFTQVSKKPANQMRMSRIQKKAFLKAMRTPAGKTNHSATIHERGAAKILGLCSSHIYASKPE